MVSEKKGASKDPEIIVICHVEAINHPGAYAAEKQIGA